MTVRDVQTRQTTPLATPTGLSSRTNIAGLIALAGFTLTMLLTGTERAMADFHNRPAGLAGRTYYDQND